MSTSTTFSRLEGLSAAVLATCLIGAPVLASATPAGADPTHYSVVADIGAKAAVGPIAVDPTSRYAFVVNDNRSVSVIDIDTDAIVKKIKLGSGLRGVAVDPSTHTAYVVTLDFTRCR